MKIKNKPYFCFLILIAYLPFQIALNLKAKYDLASIRILILILFIAVLILLIHKKELKLNHLLGWQSFFLFLFFAWSLISLIKAPNLIWGLRKIAYLGSIFPLYFITIFLAKKLRQTTQIAIIFIYSLGLSALIGLIQFSAQFIFGIDKVYQFWAVNILPIFSGFQLGAMILTYPSWLVNINGETLMRSFSFFSDPHMFSFCLGMIIPFTTIILIANKNKIIIFISYLLMASGLMLSFTRGAYLAIILTLALVSWMVWRYLGKKIIPLLFLGTILVFLIPGSPIADRFYSSFDLSEGSNKGRLEMWEQASKVGLNQPWQGIGLGNYSLSLNKKLDYRNPATAHNFYLDLFSELGLIGLSIWMLLILGTIWQLFKKLYSEINQKTKIIIISLIGSLTYFSVHSFFETAIYQPIILSILMIILGLSSLLSQNKIN